MRGQPGARRQAEFGLGAAQFADQPDKPVDVRARPRIALRHRLGPFGGDERIGRAVAKAGPQFFGDKGHERKEHDADLVEQARKSVVEGKGVTVRVDRGGSSIIKKKKTTIKIESKINK